MLAVPDVPAECRQLHDHDHLRSSDVDGARGVRSLALNVRNTHVAHDYHEADPWHIWAFHVGGNHVCGGCIGDDQSQPSPEIEQTNKIEYADGNDEPVLQLRVVVWQALEHSGQGI